MFTRLEVFIRRKLGAVLEVVAALKELSVLESALVIVAVF